ncbi:glutaredoxin domain protein [Aspergillus avenaceus]|uniref:Glutaredoxin domain protein n=1 Tax=Aspergillus avenaceus TaxID=36643 RepID=A0A5N6THR2_ASPAV|nr:glutaredoxin domain protein [Aspergillus avenaceus]
MFSKRRLKALAIAALVLTLVALYYSGDAHGVQNQKFYQSTVAALEAHKLGKDSMVAAGGSSMNELPNGNTVREIEKIAGDDKEPTIPKNDNQEMEEISIAGRTRITVPKDRNSPEKQEQTSEASEGMEAKIELNGILKRSPIIVFSKSYCPYSAKAKSILLDKYSIVPTPYVVELDQHPMGQKLQALLADNTGRRTVPNVLISGRSIGGGDDISGLDEKDELASTLKKLGGQWVQEISRKETSH